MSSQVFPQTSLPGIRINVKRAIQTGVKIQTTDSGKELRVQRHAPRIRYDLSLEVLRDSANETQTLLNFISAHTNWDSFLFDDPYDNVQRRVRFDMDEFELERVVTGMWSMAKLRMLSVL